MQVTSCACRFCLVFGREEKVGHKRKASNKCKYFEQFRTDHYSQHLVQQYPLKWKEYTECSSNKEKEAFFMEVEVPFVNRIESHFESSGTILHFIIKKSIVEDIISGLLFHPDDFEGITMARALSLFKKIEPDINSSIETTSLIPREE